MKNPKTRLALLGTMSDLHKHPIRYDLACLQNIVAELAPDLLCAEVTREDWEQGNISHSSVEIRESLAPIIAVTDTVLIPVAPNSQQFSDFAPRDGWRYHLVQKFDRFFRWGQMQANNPDTVNGPWFGAFCHTVCMAMELLWSAEERASWEKQNWQLVENIVQAIKRDTGRRVLVAVQCQRVHHLIPLLRVHADLFDMVGYQNL
jgi:hypothetical protein